MRGVRRVLVICLVAGGLVVGAQGGYRLYRYIQGGESTWSPAPGAAIGPETTRIDVLIDEHGCRDDRTSEGRVREPDVDYAHETVVVIYTVDPLPPGAYTCPHPPPTPAVLILDEPLGERVLLDGGTDPLAGLRAITDRRPRRNS